MTFGGLEPGSYFVRPYKYGRLFQKVKGRDFAVEVSDGDLVDFELEDEVWVQDVQVLVK